MFESLYTLSGPWLVVWLTVTNGTASGWFGYDMGLWSGINVGEPFNRDFPANRKAGTQGILGSCFALGNFIASCMVGWLGGRIGRKRVIFWGSTISGLGVVLQSCAFSLPQLFVGRILNGFGNGMTSSTTSMYQAECTKGHLRGRLVLVVAILNIAFYSSANWLTFATNFMNNSGQWRIPIAAQLVFLIPIYMIIPWLPESPRWLLSKGRREAALHSLCRLFGKPSDDAEVLHEFDSMSTAVELEKESPVRFKSVLYCQDNVGNLHRILLGCGTQFMQQFTGINALNYYLAELLENVIGLSPVIARLVAGANSSQYFIFSCLGLLLIDSFGRRKLMICGAVGQAVAYTGAGICVALAHRSPHALGILGATFLFVYYAAFGLSWTAIPWIYSSEINSYALRTAGMSAATATNWLSSFIVVQFTPAAIQNLGWGLFILFAGFNILFAVISWIFYPETANRTLEDLDEYFHSAEQRVFCAKSLIATSSKRPQIFLEREEERVRAGAEMRAANGFDKGEVTEMIEDAHKGP